MTYRNSQFMYSQTAKEAILLAMGISVEVSIDQEIPGDVFIDIEGLPSYIDSEIITRALTDNNIKPMTDNVTVRFT